MLNEVLNLVVGIIEVIEVIEESKELVEIHAHIEVYEPP